MEIPLSYDELDEMLLDELAPDCLSDAPINLTEWAMEDSPGLDDLANAALFNQYASVHSTSLKERTSSHMDQSNHTLTFNMSGVGDMRNEVLGHIEAIFESITDALLAETTSLCITLNTHRIPRPDAEHASVSNGHGRDLYYRDPALFGKQSVVDRYVDYISSAFGIPRSLMNVTAASKGLIAGRVVLSRRTGLTVQLANSSQGILVPSMDDVLSVDLSATQWIIVVEKEATFQAVLTSDKWKTMQWQGIIVTGKGYPDIATRAMVRFLTRPSPQNGFADPPIYGLMDYDPDGMAILSTYKRGSIKFSHDSEGLTVPEMRWLGLRSRHIADDDLTHRIQGLMPLTRRDRCKARKMLEPNWCVDGESAEWRHELQVMLVLNLKAELQILDTIPEGLASMMEHELSPN
ncbi:hypothetical protein MBLNU459_g3144t1 [Dothideomycetes sp. NU459]